MGYRVAEVDGVKSDDRSQSRDDTWLGFVLVEIRTGKSYDFMNL